MRIQENNSVTYKKIIKAVNGLSLSDKEKLFLKLKKERISFNIKKLRNRSGADALTLAEITREVESVRKSRYESKKKKQGSN
jgi:hypothetical protein